MKKFDIDPTILSAYSYRGFIDKHVIMSIYGFSEKTAERKLKKLGLTHSSTRCIDMMRLYDQGLSSISIAKELGVSQVAVSANLRRKSVEVRRTQYMADFHYFDVIDSEEKAYFLGFIYADGCLHKNSLSLLISSVDKDILEKLKHCMRSNHPIRDSVSSSTFGNRPISCFLVTSRFLSQGLIKHGVIPRKTHILTFPEFLRPDLIRHFVRGYFDGDGSFSYYVTKTRNERKYIASFCGTIDFLEGVRSAFVEQTKSSLNSKLRTRFPLRESNIRSLVFNGKRQVLSLLHWMYDDATVFLNRKYVKFLNLPK